jgi:hypothetical protein
LNIFWGHLVIFPLLVCCTKKNMATLVTSRCSFGTQIKCQVKLIYIILRDFKKTTEKVRIVRR